MIDSDTDLGQDTDLESTQFVETDYTDSEIRENASDSWNYFKIFAEVFVGLLLIGAMILCGFELFQNGSNKKDKSHRTNLYKTNNNKTIDAFSEALIDEAQSERKKRMRNLEKNPAAPTEIISEYLDHLASLDPIPKKIHIAWKYKNLLNSTGRVTELGVKNLKSMNPDWQFNVYDDADVEAYIEEKLSAKDSGLIKDRHIIEKVDLFRLLIIYFEGGIYQDVDKFYNIPMNELIDEKWTKVLLPTYGDQFFAQDWMCSSARNDLFKNAIEINLVLRREQKGDINGQTVLDLGPRAYFEAVVSTLFGIPKLPEWKYLEEMRRVIENEKHQFIKTHKDVLPCDAISYQADKSSECSRIDTKSVHAEYNMTHWDIEVNRPKNE